MNKTISMKTKSIKSTMFFAMLFVLLSCNSAENEEIEIEVQAGTETETGGENTNSVITELPSAFDAFDTDETDIYISGSGTTVTIETTGLPNHTSPYWSESHPLYVAPTVTSESTMTPTRIDTSGRDLSGTLTVSAKPEKASSTTATSLGAIGIAVSGAYIYNDQEGNGPLDAAAVSLDYSGAHIGPSQYHYHLEPLAFTNDDDKLVGIMADGFFIYGRKDYPSNDYPTDLDASGGHFGATPHNPDGEYHYHIINELYSNTGKYVIFAGSYQGTPNAIN
jgi:hypothetical protein